MVGIDEAIFILFYNLNKWLKIFQYLIYINRIRHWQNTFHNKIYFYFFVYFNLVKAFSLLINARKKNQSPLGHQLK